MYVFRFVNINLSSDMSGPDGRVYTTLNDLLNMLASFRLRYRKCGNTLHKELYSTSKPRFSTRDPLQFKRRFGRQQQTHPQELVKKMVRSSE